jgi:hypothetical protein
LLKLPAATWDKLLDGLDVDQRAAILTQVKTSEVTLYKRSIKAAIGENAMQEREGTVRRFVSIRCRGGDV